MKKSEVVKGNFATIKWQAVIDARRKPLHGNGLTGGGTLAMVFWGTLQNLATTASKWAQAGTKRWRAYGQAISDLHATAYNEDPRIERTLFGAKGEVQAQLCGELYLLRRAYGDATTYDLGDLINLCHQQTEAAKRRAKAFANTSWSRWVARSLLGGAGKAHSWCNAANKLPDLQLSFKEEQQDGVIRLITDPYAVVQHHAGPWAKIWQCGNQDLARQEHDEIKALRAKHAADAATFADKLDVSPQAIRRACGSFKSNTAVGIDDWTFKEWQWLPDEALIPLGALLRRMLGSMTPPIQILAILVTLLGKKGGGSRTIANIATLYRLLMKLAGDHIKEWDAGASVFWDSALKGSSSLRAHLARALDLEIGITEDKCAMLFLWDMAKFYDSIRISILADKLIELGYPPAVLVTGLVLHKAPRFLVAGGCVGDPLVDTGRSILAGCLQSCSWARGLLNELLVKLNQVHPRSICYEHVDDLAQTIVADAKQGKRIAMQVGRMVKKAVDDLDLTLSTKSVLLPRSSPVVREVVIKLQSEGIPIRAVSKGDDVGCGTAAGVRRVASTLDRRIARGAKRGQRNGRLVKVNRAAAALTITGTATQQRYGHTAQGASPAQVAAMRASFKAGSPFRNQVCCTTTAIAWTFGTDKDPAVSIPREQLADWLSLWATRDTRQRRQARRAWHKKLATLTKAGPHKHKSSNGPMAGTICALLDMGWRPVAADSWTTGEGVNIKIDESPFTRARVLQLATTTLTDNIWKRAASDPHHNGGGLEKGPPCLRAARQAKAIFIKSKRFLEAKAVEAVIAGYDVDPDQVGKTNHDGAKVIPNEYFCQRCDLRVINSAWHCFYGCPDNDNIDASEVAQSGKLIALAEKGWNTHRCLWARGLLPRDLACPAPYDKERTYDDVKITATPNFERMAKASGRGGTDGAGAPKSLPPQCRRVASGGAVSTIMGADLWGAGEYGGFWAAVPGRQTVPRAELWAVIVFLSRIPRSLNMKLCIDASYVVNGLAKIKNRMAGDNGDMWTLLYDILQTRRAAGSDSELVKTKAHSDKPKVVFNVSVDPEQVIENCLADGAADQGALELNRVIHGHKNVAMDTKQCRDVILRLAVIKAHDWRFKQNLRYFDDPRLSVAEGRGRLPTEPEEFVSRVDDQGHNLERNGRFMRCTRCGRRRLMGNHKYWQTTSCSRDLRKRALTIIRGLHLAPTIDTEATKVQPEQPAPPKRRRIATRLYRVSGLTLGGIQQGPGRVGINAKAGRINFAPSNGGQPYPLLFCDIGDVTAEERDGKVCIFDDGLHVATATLEHADDVNEFLANLSAVAPVTAQPGKLDMDIEAPPPTIDLGTSSRQDNPARTGDDPELAWVDPVGVASAGIRGGLLTNRSGEPKARRRLRQVRPPHESFGSSLVEWRSRPFASSTCSAPGPTTPPSPTRATPTPLESGLPASYLLMFEGSPGGTAFVRPTRVVRRRLNSKQPEPTPPQTHLVERRWFSGTTTCNIHPGQPGHIPRRRARSPLAQVAAPAPDAMSDEANANSDDEEWGLPEVGQADHEDFQPEDEPQDEEEVQERLNFGEVQKARAEARSTAADLRRRKRNADAMTWTRLATTTPAATQPTSYGAPVRAQPVPPIHSSHEIFRAGVDPSLIFCGRCTCWSTNGPLRGLASLCQGPPDGREGARRLLSLGIPPTKGARIPACARLKRRRR